MKLFTSFIDSGEVRKETLDKAHAESLLKQAIRRLKYTAKMELDEDNSDFVFDDHYEAIRELSDAWITLHGYKSYSHEAIISFLSESKSLPYETVIEIDQMRKMRNGIRYYGRTVGRDKASRYCRIVSETFLLLEKKVRDKLD